MNKHIIEISSLVLFIWMFTYSMLKVLELGSFVDVLKLAGIIAFYDSQAITALKLIELCVITVGGDILIYYYAIFMSLLGTGFLLCFLASSVSIPQRRRAYNEPHCRFCGLPLSKIPRIQEKEFNIDGVKVKVDKYPLCCYCYYRLRIEKEKIGRRTRYC